MNFDPHYINQDHPVDENTFHSVVRTIRTSSTIFSKKKELVYKVCCTSMSNAYLTVPLLCRLWVDQCAARCQECELQTWYRKEMIVQSTI